MYPVLPRVFDWELPFVGYSQEIKRINWVYFCTCSSL